jgi:sodium-dependent dicarboxylate transporter 2/3/5
MIVRRKTPVELAGLIAGPVLFLILVLVPSALHRIEGAGHRPAYAAGVTVLMAVWWFTEAIPIQWTSVVPLVAYPALDVFGAGHLGSAAKAGSEYLNAYIFLFLGGMAVGAAMEHWHLHRRIALHIMTRIGASPPRLLLGILVSTGFISLWISNTATAVLMLPISAAVLSQLEHHAGRKLGAFGASIMLAVAYASNVGGIGTKIGSATNSIFVGFLAQKLQYDMSFMKYVAVGFPFVVLFIPILWLALWHLGRHDAPHSSAAGEVLRRELAELPPLAGSERWVAIVFGSAAALWMSVDFLRPLVAPVLPFNAQGRHFEAAIGLTALFALVVRGALPREAARRIPVSALVLLGGSFAMAAGIEGSGLSRWLGLELAPMARLSPEVQMFIAVASTIALSAIASNSATVNLMLTLLPGNLPMLSSVAIAASCDFALPAGTPPNAIVFGSGYIRLSTMMRVGVLLDVCAMLLVTLYGLVYLPLLFGG